MSTDDRMNVAAAIQDPSTWRNRLTTIAERNDVADQRDILAAQSAIAEAQIALARPL